MRARTAELFAGGIAAPPAAATRPALLDRFRRRAVPEGIRITKVGLWYVLLSLVVAVAATNTGNNALYMVLAVMLAILVVSGVISRQNLRGLEVAVDPPREVFANQPFGLDFALYNRSRLFPRWLLLFAVSGSSLPMLVAHLPRRATSQGRLQLILPRRGRHRLGHGHLASIFPLGFFRKGMRYPVDLELLVFPELFAAPSEHPEQQGPEGEEPSRRAGWGHDLHALRAFRPGDDPRGIHWKQTARVGELVYMEREAEDGKRLSILFDNAVGKLGSDAAKLRFERLVSEAATAAVDYLERGCEVELVTRERTIPFGGGPQQRLAMLEELALIAPVGRARVPLAASAAGPQLRLGMLPEEARA